MDQITTDELPQDLQDILLEVAQTNTPLTVIHDGQPLVVISPAKTSKPRPEFGFMQGSGEISGDIVAPVE
ncbi:MAG: type II toxin-antitoxin system Phd/YefM family antitoxin [Leptolyngbya sp. SIO3F4]|nr:type II toxin-antitoxin system Phd/YefM family antitoxin [Leptolyngbya sp. SIO3F4]